MGGACPIGPVMGEASVPVFALLQGMDSLVKGASDRVPCWLRGQFLKASPAPLQHSKLAPSLNLAPPGCDAGFYPEFFRQTLLGRV